MKPNSQNHQTPNEFRQHKTIIYLHFLTKYLRICNTKLKKIYQIYSQMNYSGFQICLSCLKYRK